MCMYVSNRNTHVCGVVSNFVMFVYSWLDLGSCLDEEEAVSKSTFVCFWSALPPPSDLTIRSSEIRVIAVFSVLVCVCTCV